jgi:REP element-mobilizing transposase RayT
LETLATSIFNLAPPSRFRGLDPNKPLSVYYRHMPHWRQESATYFVTFRLGDSLPKEKQEYLRRLRDEWHRVLPAERTKELDEQYSKNVLRYLEASLDDGFGSCVFTNASATELLQTCLLHFQDERYFLSCFVIMPNHCHLVISPFDGWQLEKILQGLKGASARQVNAITASPGSLWQDESYDHIVRDEEHLWRIVQYIGRNPSKANLPRTQWYRWIHPQWQAAGWRFVDE